MAMALNEKKEKHCDSREAFAEAHRAWNEYYYCNSDDKEKKARLYAEYAAKWGRSKEISK